MNEHEKHQAIWGTWAEVVLVLAVIGGAIQHFTK